MYYTKITINYFCGSQGGKIDDRVFVSMVAADDGSHEESQLVTSGVT